MRVDKFALFMAGLACLIFIGCGLACYQAVQTSLETRKQLDEYKTTVAEHFEVNSVADRWHQEKIDTLQAETQALQNRVDVLEESIDPENALWARTKQLREAVRHTAKEGKFTLGFKRTEDLTTYAGAVIRHTEEYDVPITLALAIARAETGNWRPTAVSIAGAIGLYQVMPSTGVEIAQELNVHRHRTAHLTKVKTSTRFGIYYLSKMLDEFDRDINLAIRAYNCGPSYTHKVISGEFKTYPDETECYARAILGDADLPPMDCPPRSTNTEGYIRYYEKLGL